MLKIIIPLAGSSEMFVNAGYVYPKSLIEIEGLPMIQHVLENPSKITAAHQFIFIVREEEIVKFHIDNSLRLLSPGCEIVSIKHNTKGALCSVLMAVDLISDNESILILNGDQIVDMDFNQVNEFWKAQSSAAGLVTFKSVHPRWSYARMDGDEVVQTAEKNPISHHAIAGYYYFKKAKDFFACAYQSIKNDVQLDGNFFVSPVINQYVLQNKKVSMFTIETEAYHSFYSPQMLNEYERKRNR